MWITIFCFYLLGTLLQKHQELELKALMRILDSEKKKLMNCILSIIQPEQNLLFQCFQPSLVFEPFSTVYGFKQMPTHCQLQFSCLNCVSTFVSELVPLQSILKYHESQKTFPWDLAFSNFNLLFFSIPFASLFTVPCLTVS